MLTGGGGDGIDSTYEASCGEGCYTVVKVAIGKVRIRMS